MAESASGAEASAPTALDRLYQAEPAAAPTQAQLENSQNAIRDTTKWLVAAAAAVGAVIVAGLQLSNLPYGTWASLVAIAGFVLAIIGVAAVIFSAAEVLVVGYTTLGELADKPYETESDVKRKRRLEGKIKELEEKNKFLSAARGMASVRALLLRAKNRLRIALVNLRKLWHVRADEEKGVRNSEMTKRLDTETLIFSKFQAEGVPDLYGQIVRTYNSYNEIVRDQGMLSKSGELDWPRLAALEWRARRLETAAGQVIAFANQAVIEQRFNRLKRSVGYGGLAVIAGVGLFALAPKIAAERPLTIAHPTKVIVVVKDPSKFGPNCEDTRLSAVATGGTWDDPVIVSLPRDGCKAAELVLTPGIGYAVPAPVP